ncbi:hypothetical protein BH20PSE1_BH20PSE1_01290 [soil metagenome]
MDMQTVQEIEQPIIKNTPALRTLVTAEFRRIEKMEEEIAERRNDIKEAVKRMTSKGLHGRALKLALARRKLVLRGGLEEMDESLTVICGIGSLGIQGSLFSEDDEGVGRT